jgi:hypothetical protein
VLWERYKIISRGRAPQWYDVPEDERAYTDGEEKVRVRLEDIRDYFGAQYVIVDQDHKAFRRKLDAANEFCERIYPAPDPEPDTKPADQHKKREPSPPYTVYRVFSAHEQEAAEAAAKKERLERTRRNVDQWRARRAERLTAGPSRQPTTRPHAR